MPMQLCSITSLGTEVAMVEVVGAAQHVNAADQRAQLVRSCAGYSAAYYVIGVLVEHCSPETKHTTGGDRTHSLFRRLLKRRKSPGKSFVLPQDLALKMGGGEGRQSLNYQQFATLCCDCFMSLRRRAAIFINMLSLMQFGGVTSSQVSTIRSAFHLEKVSEPAAETFVQEKIDTALQYTLSKIDWSE